MPHMFVIIYMALEKFNYIIIPELRLILRYYRGSFKISDLVNALEETAKNSLYDTTFNVINDFRDARSEIKIGEINDFFGYIKGHKKLYGKRKSVYLTKTPNQTVFSMMLGLLKHEKLISFKTFSTLEEAVKWVDLPVSELEKIEKAIAELKEK
jgi:hypothetical protein